MYACTTESIAITMYTALQPVSQLTCQPDLHFQNSDYSDSDRLISWSSGQAAFETEILTRS